MSEDQAYTMAEMAKMLKITVKTLYNRLSEGRNHPPYIRGLERPFPKDEYMRWCKSKIQREVRSA